MVSTRPGTPGTADNRRIFSALVIGLLVSTFVSDSRLAKLPVQFLLKDGLHVTPLQMAAFFSVVGLAWYFKPLAGLLADAVPLGGLRRRPYLLIAGLGAGVLWVLLGIIPRQFAPLMWTLTAANAFTMLASSVSGGLLVEVGQAQGRTGRMGTLRETIIAGTLLLAQPVGGYLATKAFGWTCGIGATLLLGLIAAAFLVRETRAEPLPGGFAQVLRRRLAPVLRARGLWLAAAFLFLKELSPGFNTPLFYIQTNTLGFSAPFLGWLGALGNGAAIVGALVYGVVCKRVPLSTLLVLSVVLSAVSSLLFLGLHSHASAILIQTLSGVLGVFVSVALMDMAARATPRGGEAMGYAILMSTWNFGGQVSDILGSYLYDKAHVPFHALVWISAGTTLLALLALPLVPCTVLEHSDAP